MLWEKAARLAVLAAATVGERPSRSGRSVPIAAWRARLAAALDEACAVAAADGVALDAAAQWAIIEAMPDDLTTSAARDAASGRPTELDAIAGSVVRAGAQARRADAGARRAPRGGGMPSAIALIGARAGSERVPGKNVRPLAGHPLLAYAIATARQSEVFDRIVVSTDSEEIAQVARWYGADVPFLRPDGVRDVDLAGHRVDRLDAAAARRALRPVRDRARDEPVPRART